MSTTSTTLSRPTHPPQHDQQSTPQVRRVGLVDRAALHLGVALITWGRRPQRVSARSERRVNRAELALLHRERQQALASLSQAGGSTAHYASLTHLR